MVARVITNAVRYICILFSLTLLLAGHNEPGGGFVAGAMTASVFALLYLVFGKDYVESRFQTDYRTLAVSGFLITIFFALMPLVLGEPVLSSILFSFDLPQLGRVELASAVGFDFGIYLVVVGSILTILRWSAGGEELG
ncbi:MAG: Na(+)/H(+) antiporter subunit B [Candidatus Thermoplasmatota archaeon]|nr:Na(+)/H(+) antiporter subunit B [Candidatus Thermoplasmatota archaeon]